MSSVSLRNKIPLESHVYSICLGADIQNRGYEKSKIFYQENTYYIEVQDHNLNTNPLMNFGDNDFGFENEENKESAEVVQEAMFIQMKDKAVYKINLDKQMDEPPE
jgi:hypothetical protein